MLMFMWQQLFSELNLHAHALSYARNPCQHMNRSQNGFAPQKAFKRAVAPNTTSHMSYMASYSASSNAHHVFIHA